MSERDYLVSKGLRKVFGLERVAQARGGVAATRRGSIQAAERLKGARKTLDDASDQAVIARQYSSPTRSTVRRSMAAAHKRFGRYPQMPPHQVRYGPKGHQRGTVFGDIMNPGAQGRDFADFPGERYSRNVSPGNYRAGERARARGMDEEFDFSRTYHRAAKYGEASARAGVRRAGAAEATAGQELRSAKRGAAIRIGGTAAAGTAATGGGVLVARKRRRQ